jgi:hypothetical protein
MKMFGFSLALNKALVVGAIDTVREVAVNHTSRKTNPGCPVRKHGEERVTII